jgi:hypothetical protein
MDVVRFFGQVVDYGFELWSTELIRKINSQDAEDAIGQLGQCGQWKNIKVGEVRLPRIGCCFICMTVHRKHYDGR